MISPEKFRNLAAGLLSVTTAVALPFCGIWISKAIKDREVQGKFVELSVTILRDKPSDETKNLRKWATRVLNEYSGVSLSAEEIDDLVGKVQLPQADSGTAEALPKLVGTYNPNGGPITLTIKTGFAAMASYQVFQFEGTDKKELCRGNSSAPFSCTLPKPDASHPERKLSFAVAGVLGLEDTNLPQHQLTLSQDNVEIGRLTARTELAIGPIELRPRKGQ